MADPNALILKMSADISGMQKQISAAVGIVDTGSARMVLRSKEAAAAIEKSFGTVTVDGFKTGLAEVATLQDRLSAAQVAGNAAEAKALRAELGLRGAVQKAAVAQLETQLAIARATGNKGQVAQLTEALALQGQISKFQGVGLTGTRALTEAEHAINGIVNAEKAAEGANVGRALEGIFDRAHVTLYEEAGAKIPLFGSALEALGPAGLAAAAGVAALAIAAESARKAMEWADDLDRTAKKLGVTTTSLQELDYASVATAIGLQQGREALSQFNGEIGKFEAHTGDKRLVKWADGIKLTRAEVSQTIDPVEKLSLVMEKIAKLPNAQERTAAAKAFGLDGLLPIINEGSEGIDKFIGKMKEAQANGSIVSEGQIATAAEMNDKVEELTYRIGVDFKKAFIDVAPVIERVAEFIERCTHALSDFLGEIPNAIAGVQDLIDKLPHIPTGVNVSQGLKDAARDATLGVIPGARQAADLGDAVGGAFKGLVARGEERNHRFMDPDDPDVMAAELRAARNSRQGPGEQINFDTPKPAKPDDTLQRSDQVDEILAQQEKAYLEAQKALTQNVEDRAAFERQALQQELIAETAKLQKQKDALAKDKSVGLKGPADQAHLAALADQVDSDQRISAERKAQLVDEIVNSKTKRAELSAALDVAAATAASAIAAKQDLNDRDEQFTVRKELNDATVELNDMMNRQLAAQASIAPTAAKRAELELEIFKYQQDTARLQYKYNLALEVATQKITPGEAVDRLKVFDQTQSAELGAQRQHQFLNANPIAAYLNGLQDVNKVMQQDGVEAAHDLSQALTDAALGAKSFGQAMLDVFRNLFAKLLEQSIERDIAAPILGGLGSFFGFPGHAAGTNYSPGGWHWVGERGPELMNVPTGAQIIPANQTLSALKNMSVPQASGGLTVIQPFHFHAEGAVMTAELLAQANQQAAGYANQAYVRSLRDGRKALPDALRAHQQLRG